MSDAEPRQRWRLFYRVEPGAALPQRQALDAWRRSLALSGLPLAGEPGDPGRPRLGVPPPLPVGMQAEQDVLDLYLTKRLPQALVRRRLAPVLPPGHELLGLRDVWVGAPPLAAQVVAADYRMVLDGSPRDAGDGPRRLREAIDRFRAASRWLRPHRKDAARTYDLRPLVADLLLRESEAGPVLRVRVRFDPVLGAGRPEAVVEALADAAGFPLVPRPPIVRERLWLADERPLPLGPLEPEAASVAAVPPAKTGTEAG